MPNFSRKKNSEKLYKCFYVPWFRHFSPRLGEINPVWQSFSPHTVASVGQIHWEESFRARAATPERKSRVFTQEHEALKRAKSSVGAAK